MLYIYKNDNSKQFSNYKDVVQFVYHNLDYTKDKGLCQTAIKYHPEDPTTTLIDWYINDYFDIVDTKKFSLSELVVNKLGYESVVDFVIESLNCRDCPFKRECENNSDSCDDIIKRYLKAEW